MALYECGLNINSTRKELQPHGTKEFPCAGYESVLDGKPEAMIPWHWHEEFEMIYVSSGCMKLLLPSQCHILHAGMMAVLNANVLHYAEAAPEGSMQTIVFSPILLTGTLQSSYAVNYILPLSECREFMYMEYDAANDNVRRFIKAFDAIKDGSFAFEFIVREQLSHIMLSVFRHYQDILGVSGRNLNPDTSRMEKMLGFIHDHYCENITLRDIYHASDVGEREALRCFKRTIGESPMQYLQKYRLMQGAEMLLSEPDENIAEIAGRCGFDSSSYFSKKFRMIFRCTPREYVKSRVQTKVLPPDRM